MKYLFAAAMCLGCLTVVGVNMGGCCPNWCGTKDRDTTRARETTVMTTADPAGQPCPNSATASIATFIPDAAMSSNGEVELSQLAEERAMSPRVKSFAQKMITDHQAMSRQLKQVADQVDVSVPNRANATQQAAKNSLERLTGRSFDQSYTSQMVSDHEQSVLMFENAAQNHPTQVVREFAARNLPTLQEHLRQAREIQQSLNVRS